MKAVILAAGRGSRIEKISNSGPKPLVRLLGLSLIERVILSIKEGGIKDFIIVTGYRAEEIKTYLGSGSHLGVKITYVDNPQWSKGNGTSLLAVKGHIKGKFILSMADHVFTPEIVKELKKQPLKDALAVVVAEPSPQPYIDLEDATKIKTQNTKVIEIGKNIEGFSHIDCGVFLVSDKIFEYIEKLQDRPTLSLNDIMQEVGLMGKLRIFELKGQFWIDVDTPEAYRKAEELLCNSLVKPTDGFISRTINRPISLMISRKLVNTGLSPNTITLFSFMVSVISAIFLAVGNYLMTFLGGIFVQLSSIVDGCDGEVARLKHRTSEYGAWLDSVLDRYSDALIIMGITVGLYNYGLSGSKIWIIGYLALMGSLINSYTATKFDSLIKTSPKKASWRFGRDTRLFIIMMGAILNQLYYVLLFLAIITNFVSIRRLVVMKKAY
ncbi:MAG: hypothetical protein D6778_06960 [Nitrospirae bacterium]|nr:MAG: hypothetical protein D6778_06960 [Nitrospirota bacterium]